MVVGGPNSRWQDKVRAPGFPSRAIDHLCDPEGSYFWWRAGGGCDTPCFLLVLFGRLWELGSFFSTLAIPLCSGQVEFLRGGVGAGHQEWYARYPDTYLARA
jgi:hypothetical protein